VIQLDHRRIAFGSATTISGWLGTSTGIALDGQTIRIFTAPDNGLERFTQAVVATTRVDGSWSARLPGGPSRLVQAVYDGGALFEPGSSAYARVLVPARVLLKVSPRATRWGGTVRISGRVLGGYIPGVRQQLLRLRIGALGFSSTVGIPNVKPNGRFQTTFTFHPGTGVVTYWFAVATLNEAAYPYVPASSPAVTVRVG
jgi:hypothetical protein